eukprot:TRINITY_DN14121_c0_g1_i2.p1 TRINITY_DN14121_c0_g1~~TRINITY_DN14121_c0_g1_i2.p1  ORF type:complete len:904 (+),score=187.19 TRINITY_DN14121_c0_g1_i2:242-2953(+)
MNGAIPVADLASELFILQQDQCSRKQAVGRLECELAEQRERADLRVAHVQETSWVAVVVRRASATSAPHSDPPESSGATHGGHSGRLSQPKAGSGMTLRGPRRSPRASDQGSSGRADDHRRATPRHLSNPAVEKKTIQWRKGDLLGQGAFGTVHVGINSATGEWMAVKNIKFNRKDPQIGKKIAQLQNEIALMKTLDHPNIVRYFFSERCGDSINIFMEYVAGGSMLEMLKQFGGLPLNLVNFYTREVLLGLEYLHHKNVIHRDIKSANILIGISGDCRLADFGCSSAITDTCARRSSLQGTPLWMAPEVITQQEYGSLVDIWSLGCTIMEMITAQPPFHHLGFNQLGFMRFISGDGLEEPDSIDDKLPDVMYAEDMRECREVMMHCLQRDPEARWSAEALLAHAWVRQSEAEPDDASEEGDEWRMRRLMLQAAANCLCVANRRVLRWQVWSRLAQHAIRHLTHNQADDTRYRLQVADPSAPGRHGISPQGLQPLNMNLTTPVAQNRPAVDKGGSAGLSPIHQAQISPVSVVRQDVDCETEGMSSPYGRSEQPALLSTASFIQRSQTAQTGDRADDAEISDQESDMSQPRSPGAANPFSWVRPAGEVQEGCTTPNRESAGRAPRELGDFQLGMKVVHDRRGEGTVTNMDLGNRAQSALSTGSLTVLYRGGVSIKYRAAVLPRGRLQPAEPKVQRLRRVKGPLSMRKQHAGGGAAPTAPGGSPSPSVSVIVPASNRSPKGLLLPGPGGARQTGHRHRPSVMPAMRPTMPVSPGSESGHTGAMMTMADKARGMHDYLQKRASTFFASMENVAAEPIAARVVDQVMDVNTPSCSPRGSESGATLPRTPCSLAAPGQHGGSGGLTAEELERAQQIEDQLRLARRASPTASSPAATGRLQIQVDDGET